MAINAGINYDPTLQLQKVVTPLDSSKDVKMNMIKKSNDVALKISIKSGYS